MPASFTLQALASHDYLTQRLSGARPSPVCCKHRDIKGTSYRLFSAYGKQKERSSATSEAAVLLYQFVTFRPAARRGDRLVPE